MRMKIVPINTVDGLCKCITTRQGRLGWENFLGRLEHGGWDTMAVLVLEVYEDNLKMVKKIIRYPHGWNKGGIFDNDYAPALTTSSWEANNLLIEIYEREEGDNVQGGLLASLGRGKPIQLADILARGNGRHLPDPESGEERCCCISGRR